MGFTPGEVAGLRLFFGALALSPFVFFAFKKIPLAKYKYVLICAVVGNWLPALLYPVAQTRISSSVTGIINSLTPLCTYFIGITFFGLRYHRLKLVGILFGFLGAVSLILFKPTAQLTTDLAFLFIALSVPFMYGLNSNVIKRHLTHLPAVPLTAIMYFIFLLPGIPMLLRTGVPEKVATVESARGALPYVILLGVFATALAMSLFNILLKRAPVMFAASATYLMPVVALLLGILDHEQVGLPEFLGLTLILSGVIIINRVKE